MCSDTEFDDSYFGFLAGVLAGHVPFHGTTVNPALLMQPPSRVVAPSEGNTQNVVTSRGVGCSAMANTPQEGMEYNPPAWHPRCPFFEINDDFTKPYAGAMRSTRRKFRGTRVDNAVSAPCQWQSQDSLICGQQVTGPSVPTHLADHGIQNMGRDCVAQCCWRECGAQIKRQGMTRHFREVHLGLKRKSCAVADTPV